MKSELPGVGDANGAAVTHVRYGYSWGVSNTEEAGLSSNRGSQRSCEGCSDMCSGCVCYWSSVGVDSWVCHTDVRSIGCCWRTAWRWSSTGSRFAPGYQNYGECCPTWMSEQLGCKCTVQETRCSRRCILPGRRRELQSEIQEK